MQGHFERVNNPQDRGIPSEGGPAPEGPSERNSPDNSSRLATLQERLDKMQDNMAQGQVHAADVTSLSVISSAIGYAYLLLGAQHGSSRRHHEQHAISTRMRQPPRCT